MTFVQEHLVGRVDFLQFYRDEGVAFPQGGKRGLCPFHDDNTPSFDVVPDTGLFKCRACGAGGDPVTFLGKRQTIDATAAIAELRRRYRIPRGGNGVRGQASPERTWVIRDADGTAIAEHHRRDLDAGRKKFRWTRKGESGLGGLSSASLPLYGSENVKNWPGEAVITLHEGEKKTDAMTARGFHSLGTVTGAAGTPSFAVLEILRGRSVVLWGDHDDAGRRHRDAIAERLQGIAASVQILEWGEEPGDDAFDFFARGGTEEQLDQMLADAPEWHSATSFVSTEPLLSVSLLDLDRKPPPPVRWIVEELLPKGELALLFGKPFGGKSLFALQLGLCGSSGLTFLPLADSIPNGFQVPEPLRILYVDEEMGLPLLWQRLRLMRSGRTDFNEGGVLERFRVVSRKGLRLDDKSRFEILRREVSRFPGGAPDLILFDTLRRMHVAPEKDSELMARVMGTAISLGEEFGSSCLALHHSKKGPLDDDEDWREAARGSGDLVAAAQSVIGMLKTGDCLFTARADAKAAGEVQPFPLLLDGQTLLFRRQTEEERFATKDTLHEAAVREAEGELCRALTKLQEAGSEKYPPSWTSWRDRARGNPATLAQARQRLLQSQDGRDPVIREIKRTGKGGGKAYLFAQDYDTQVAASGTQTRFSADAE